MKSDLDLSASGNLSRCVFNFKKTEFPTGTITCSLFENGEVVPIETSTNTYLAENLTGSDQQLVFNFTSSNPVGVDSVIAVMYTDANDTDKINQRIAYPEVISDWNAVVKTKTGTSWLAGSGSTSGSFSVGVATSGTRLPPPPIEVAI